MASTDDRQVTDAAQQANGIAQPDIADLLGIARRGWFFIIAGALLGLIGAAVIISNLTPSYKATARIGFEKTIARYMQSNKVSNEPIIDDWDTLGQSYVISSEAILLQTIRTLSLATDPDFVGDPNRQTTMSRLRNMVREAAQSIRIPENLRFLEPAAEETNTPVVPKDPEKVALDALMRNLTVNREEVASVVSVAYTSKDPVKAAKIVNTVVDAYIDQGMTEKRKSSGVARKVLVDRLEELRQQVKDADRALLEYKASNNIVGSDRMTLTHGQLYVLQTQIANARLAMADAKARMDRAPDAAQGGPNLAPDNEMISRLRTELMDLSVRANDIEKLVGPKHAAVLKIRNRMEDVERAIANEQRRIAGSSGKDYELAKARFEELSEAAAQVVASEGSSNIQQAKLRELEGAVDTLRNLYNRTLQEVTETSKADTSTSITPDVRILNRASPPLQTEASKKKWLILGGGSILGLLLGCGIVLWRNPPFGVFRTPQQVTYATGLPCAILPEITGNAERAAVRNGEYGLNAPYSRFSQALRTVWAAINTAQREAGAKVVGVISSNPGEGKTTIAINLSAHFGRHSTARVLLIDADFYRQTLTKSVAEQATVGLREALKEPAALSKFVVRKDKLNLDVLPCPLADYTPDATEMLGTTQMDQLIAVARESYDLVVIESPPMSALVDYKMIARHCDGFVMVVEWGKTSQRLVLECLTDASALLDRVLCVILNKADAAALRSIEHYKGERFHAYYTDQKRAARG